MKQLITKLIARETVLYTVLVKFYRAMLRIKNLLSNPWTYAKHRVESKVIAGPGFLGLKGGLFNPGAINQQGDIVILAKGQFQHWLEADGRNYNNFQKGCPVFLVLDQRLQVTEQSRVTTLTGYPPGDNLELEDFRIFSWGEELWVNHYLIEVVRTPAKLGYAASRPCLSKLNCLDLELTYLGEPKLDFDIQTREKNWVFLHQEGQLYLFYSFHPFRVLKLEHLPSFTFSTIIDTQIHPRLKDIGGFGTLVSYSSNPIVYDERHFLILVHQCDPTAMGRLYYQWGVLLDQRNFMPTRITSQPLFSGVGARGRLPGVLYVMSIVQLGDEFLFLNGEGDSFITYIRMSKNRLDRCWTDIGSLS